MSASNPFDHLIKVAEKSTPMAVYIPFVVEKLQVLEIGQGVELPATKRHYCNWSNSINTHAKRNSLSLRVIQKTEAGVTTAWRVK